MIIQNAAEAQAGFSFRGRNYFLYGEYIQQEALRRFSANEPKIELSFGYGVNYGEN
jgi:hypothetical protein